MNTFLTGISIEPSIFFQNITTWVARLDFIGVVVEDDAKYKSTSIEKRKHVYCLVGSLLNRMASNYATFVCHLQKSHHKHNISAPLMKSAGVTNSKTLANHG